MLDINKMAFPITLLHLVLQGGFLMPYDKIAVQFVLWHHYTVSLQILMTNIQYWYINPKLKHVFSTLVHQNTTNFNVPINMHSACYELDMMIKAYN